MPRSWAAVFQSPGQLRLMQLDTPTPVGDQVLVRVLGCTICGSDLHSYRGRRTVPMPSILGHEIVGQIEAFGPRAARTDWSGQALELGDRISWAVVANCGECFYCRRALPQKCLTAVKYGHQQLTADYALSGGLAEHCLLVSGTKIVRWNSEVPLAVACPASCATATAMAALDWVPDLSGSSIVVTGAGLLGLTACAIAASRGAQRIVCLDPVVERQQLARQFGATNAMSPAQWPQWCQEHLPNGVDAAVEMSGSANAWELIWPGLRMGAALVLVGSVFPGPTIPVALEQIVRRCLHIHGVHNYGPQHLHEAVAFLSEHHQRFPFASLVSAWYRLEQIESALSAAEDRSVIRCGIGSRV